MTTIRDLQQRVGITNAANGWHDRYQHITSMAHGPARTDHIVAKLALITTEVAEAIEDVRQAKMETYYTINGRPVYRVTDGSVADWAADPTEPTLGTWTGVAAKPEGLPSELADIVIRTLDLAHMLGIDLEHEIDQKLAYNKTRVHMHGGKAI